MRLTGPILARARARSRNKRMRLLTLIGVQSVAVEVSSYGVVGLVVLEEDILLLSLVQRARSSSAAAAGRGWVPPDVTWRERHTPLTHCHSHSLWVSGCPARGEGGGRVRGLCDRRNGTGVLSSPRVSCLGVKAVPLSAGRSRGQHSGSGFGWYGRRGLFLLSLLRQFFLE